jgi:hypothetical protein
VALAGPSGTSTVTSDEPGIVCPGACSVSWDGGQRVVLEASPAANARILRWTGACTGAGSSCTLTMDGPKSTTVVFGPLSYSGRVSVVGKGLVTNALAGLRCARTCSARFDAGKTFTFRATPLKGWRFAGWSGDCRGKALCRLRFDRTHSFRATFKRR